MYMIFDSYRHSLILVTQAICLIKLVLLRANYCVLILKKVFKHFMYSIIMKLTVLLDCIYYFYQMHPIQTTNILWSNQFYCSIVFIISIESIQYKPLISLYTTTIYTNLLSKYFLIALILL